MSWWRFWKNPPVKIETLGQPLRRPPAPPAYLPSTANEIAENLSEYLELATGGAEHTRITHEIITPEEPKVIIKPLDLMKVNYEKSPNQSPRKGDVKYIVLHHTGPGSFNGIVKWLQNKDAKASAHYVLGTGGQLKQLVSTKRESWHAGVAKWNGKRINNHHSIGIEICNLGVLQKGDDGSYYYEQGRNLKKYTGKVKPVKGKITYPSGATLEGYYVPYPEKQITKLVALCKGIIEKYPQIEIDDIITHYEIGQPEGRKNDPFGLDIQSVVERIFDK